MNLQKTDYVRSKPLMLAYRRIPCQHCGVDDGTVCGAHSNLSIHGKGRGIKAHDNRAASLCHACHMAVDQGRSLSRSEREALWLDAHEKTVRELLRIGLWPMDVPVPDLSVLQLDVNLKQGN